MMENIQAFVLLIVLLVLVFLVGRSVGRDEGKTIHQHHYFLFPKGYEIRRMDTDGLEEVIRENVQ